MQDACNINFVIDLDHRKDYVLSGRASERGIRRSEVRFLISFLCSRTVTRRKIIFRSIIISSRGMLSSYSPIKFCSGSVFVSKLLTYTFRSKISLHVKAEKKKRNLINKRLKPFKCSKAKIYV